MARFYTLQPADRSTLKSAVKHTQKKAKAAVNTNRHLELTQGTNEAQELEGYCEELVLCVDNAVGSEIELTTNQVYAARCALRIYGGALEKKESEVGELLSLGDDVNVDELQHEITKVAGLLRVLSPQVDAFPETPEPAAKPERKKLAKATADA